MRLRRIQDEIMQKIREQDEQYEEEDEDEFMNFGQMPYIPFGEMESLSAGERKKLRTTNKNMPPYLFMTEGEKRRFFEKKSQNFNSKLQ